MSRLWIGSTRQSERDVANTEEGNNATTAITYGEAATLLIDHLSMDVLYYVQILQRYERRVVEAITTVTEWVQTYNSTAATTASGGSASNSSSIINNNSTSLLQQTLDQVRAELTLWSKIEAIAFLGASAAAHDGDDDERGQHDDDDDEKLLVDANGRTAVSGPSTIIERRRRRDLAQFLQLETSEEERQMVVSDMVWKA